MGQNIRLIDIDARVAVDMSELREGIWYTPLHEYLLPKVERYLKPLDEIRRDCFAHFPPLHSQNQSRLLTVLPLDVLRLIFESFGSPRPATQNMSAGINATSFALTCQLLFEVGHPVLKQYQAAHDEIPSGRRFIIADEALWYSSPDDIPPSLKLDPLWKSPAKDIYSMSRSWPRYYKDLREAVDDSLLFHKMRKQAPSCREYRATAALQLMWKRRFFGRRVPPSIDNAVLRNLTTKDYARGDALNKVQEEDKIKDDSYSAFGQLNIGDLAALRIIWSFGNKLGIIADESILRGPWAGHRFDIVDSSHFTDLEGWKDVSKELIDEVAEIYWQNHHYY